MKQIMFFSVFAVLMLSSVAGAEPVSLSSLQHRCAEKTRVMGSVAGKYPVVGEKIDGYCSGFLNGVISALEHEKLVCPKRDKKTIETSYLLSVLEYFVKDKSLERAAAGDVLADAFKRAFPCNE